MVEKVKGYGGGVKMFFCHENTRKDTKGEGENFVEFVNVV